MIPCASHTNVVSGNITNGRTYFFNPNATFISGQSGTMYKIMTVKVRGGSKRSKLLPAVDTTLSGKYNDCLNSGS